MLRQVKIPPGAARMAGSEGCANQAFEYGRVIGLQFHIEYSIESINLMFRNCSEEIVEGKCMRSLMKLSHITNVVKTQKLLDQLLDNMEREFGIS